MIDLHVHLDGSVRPQTIIELAREQDLPLPAYNVKRLNDFLTQPVETGNFGEYVSRFELALTVLQNRRSIRRAVSELVRDMDKQGVLYAEIRLAPQAHTLHGLSQNQVVEAAIEGLKQGMEFSQHIKANLILCTMRGADEKDNFATIVEAVNHNGRGVVGMDILGNEFVYQNDMYLEQFQLLREEHVPFTVHAGILEGAESIRQAVENGASRIGHGLRVNEDPEVLALLKSKNIILEMCPTSNICSKAVASIEDHPIKAYYDAGLKVTVGTDDMTVYDTNLKKEYELLKNGLQMTDAQIYQMNLNAVDGAFISVYEKGQLKEKLKERYSEKFVD